MRVPLFDITIAAAEREAVDEVLRGGWLTMGPKIKEFEEIFAEHLGVRHAIAVSSCTAALHLAYLAAGIGPGDEVIVPAITFVASAAGVRYCGGTPVLAEIKGRHDFGLDVEDVERRITERTKAVCTVHYGGYSASVEELKALCESRGLALVEDAAHSPSAHPIGSERKLGAWGQSGAFSFFSNKVLSCGEGGLLATDDDDVAAFARSRRSHAMTSGTWDRHRGHALSYDVVGLGYNYRLDEIRAALLIARMRNLEADIDRRRELVLGYRAALQGLAGVEVPYTEEEVGASSCYIMPVTVRPEIRDAVRRRMQEEFEVQTSVLYPSIADFTAYRDDVGVLAAGLPRCELAARSQLTLPLYPDMTEDQLGWVVEALAAALAAES